MDRAHSISGSEPGLQFDLEKTVDLIRGSGAKRIGLQAPEGLKRALPSLARQIEEATGAEVIISGDQCYGACDLDMALCKDVDLMLHLGHAELGEASETAGNMGNAGDAGKVIYIEARMPHDLRGVVEDAVPLLKSKRVCITTTVQHIHKLNQALEVLKQHGIKVIIGKTSGRVKYPGQVLGCCYNAARSENADEYLFIGTGKFHPLGIAMATGKRVVTADPVTGEVSEIDPNPMLRRRFASITRAMDAKRFAVLVSKKPGQKRMELASRIKKMGEEKGKEMILVYLDNIEPDKLLNLGIEAAVSTACPRVALDDASRYKIPILTPPEFEILAGNRCWEEYAFDEIE
ncbi:MAG: diphthamide biosynthesis enzyme Dph2 [Methanotrichaceae archaeon]